MNKRLLLAFVAVFVFMFFYEWIFHGIMLKSTYAETAYHWRSEKEMLSYCHWLLIGRLFITAAFCFVFASGRGLSSIKDGAEVGLWFSLFYVGDQLMRYAVEPLPLSLILIWSVGTAVELIAAGAITAAVYKNSK